MSVKSFCPIHSFLTFQKPTKLSPAGRNESVRFLTGPLAWISPTHITGFNHATHGKTVSQTRQTLYLSTNHNTFMFKWMPSKIYSWGLWWTLVKGVKASDTDSCCLTEQTAGQLLPTIKLFVQHIIDTNTSFFCKWFFLCYIVFICLSFTLFLKAKAKKNNVKELNISCEHIKILFGLMN